MKKDLIEIIKTKIEIAEKALLRRGGLKTLNNQCSRELCIEILHFCNGKTEQALTKIYKIFLLSPNCKSIKSEEARSFIKTRLESFSKRFKKIKKKSVSAA